MLVIKYDLLLITPTMAGDKRERKRKREIEENERPNKKVAFENRERSIEVSIRQDGGAWTPVIGRFSFSTKYP